MATADVRVKVKVGIEIGKLGIPRKINKRQLCWVDKRKHRSKVNMFK